MNFDTFSGAAMKLFILEALNFFLVNLPRQKASSEMFYVVI